MILKLQWLADFLHNWRTALPGHVSIPAHTLEHATVLVIVWIVAKNSMLFELSVCDSWSSWKPGYQLSIRYQVYTAFCRLLMLLLLLVFHYHHDLRLLLIKLVAPTFLDSIRCWRHSLLEYLNVPWAVGNPAVSLVLLILLHCHREGIRRKEVGSCNLQVVPTSLTG